MRPFAFALPLALAVGPVAGCIVIELPGDLEFDREWSDGPASFDGANGQRAGRGRVSGDIGPVRGFEGSTDSIDVSADEYWSSITISTNDDEGRMGMLIVEIEGADIRALPSGTYRYSSSGVDGPAYVSSIYVTGCSSSWDADYDAGANEGVIVVDNDGDDCNVDVEAQLPSDEDAYVTTTATGSFTVTFE